MSSELTPEQALSLIPELRGRECRLSVLPGGLTNRNFKVSATDRHFVLRLDDKHTGRLGIDREAELQARRQAFAAGIGARIVYSSPEQGVLLSEYLHGVIWDRTDLDDTHNLLALAGLLREVHQLPLLDVRFDAVRTARQYASRLQQDSVLSVIANNCIQLVERVPAPASLRCCHNDIVAANVLQSDRLILLDWEYASDNDPLFDLASLVGFHDLDEQQTDMLLGAYTGRSDPADRERLELQIRLFDAIQWLWIAVRQQTSPNPALSNRLVELRQRTRF